MALYYWFTGRRSVGVPQIYDNNRRFSYPDINTRMASSVWDCSCPVLILNA